MDASVPQASFRLQIVSLPQSEPEPPPSPPLSLVASTLQTSLSWERLCMKHGRRRHGRDANGQKQHPDASPLPSAGGSLGLGLRCLMPLLCRPRPLKARGMQLIQKGLCLHLCGVIHSFVFGWGSDHGRC